MRTMIIGLSTLALVALPTLAVADGDGALTGAAGGAVAGAVVWHAMIKRDSVLTRMWPSFRPASSSGAS